MRKVDAEIDRLMNEEGKTEEEIDEMIDNGEIVFPKEIEEGTPEEVGYFRKVNFLMEFFNYEGNCEYKEITKGEIEELVDRCREVAKITPYKVEVDTEKRCYSDEDIEKANALLPTQSGFFFGSTDYDEWYFNDVKEVLNWALGIRDTFDWENDVLLMYCWW